MAARRGRSSAPRSLFAQPGSAIGSLLVAVFLLLAARTGARRGGREVLALRDVGLVVPRGMAYGLVGESGSGKSTLALAALRHLGGDGRVVHGRIELGGEDLWALSPAALRAAWRERLRLVPQDPLASLNPSLPAGRQVAEGLAGHGAGRAAARVAALLSGVGLADPGRVAASCPHQLSGGMQQRVAIAMALGGAPDLLVMDEPTTNLDVTTEAAVLDLVRELRRDHETAVLYVSHSLAVVAQLCDRVAVLYASDLVEDAPVADLDRQPLHPYTRGLLDSLPRLGQDRRLEPLRPIALRMPTPDARPAACVPRPTLARRPLRQPGAAVAARRGRQGAQQPRRTRRVDRGPGLVGGPHGRRRGRLRTMTRFVARRLGYLLVTLLVTSLLIFLITQLLPGDIARVILGREASEPALEALRARLGLDRPAALQYLGWLGAFVRGDWGTSFATEQAIRPLVLERLGNSLMLAGLTLAIAVPLAIGLAAALRAGRWLDAVISIGALAVVGLPEFVTGLVLIEVFAFRLRWLPANASIAPEAGFFESLPMSVLPALTATLVLLAYIASLTPASVLEELGRAYVRTAVLKGLPPRVVLARHVFRNGLLPTVTVIAISVGWLISGLIVVENVFDYPGVGRLLTFAIDRRDVPMLQAISLVAGLAFALANLVADVPYAALNPRNRLA